MSTQSERMTMREILDDTLCQSKKSIRCASNALGCTSNRNDFLEVRVMIGAI